MSSEGTAKPRAASCWGREEMLGTGGVRRSSLPTGVIQDKGKLERVRERCTEVD